MNSHNMNIFPPLSIKVISMGTTDVTSIAKWRGQASSCWAIWRSFIAKSLLELNTCWQFCLLVLLNACWQFGDTLLLSSNDRVSSFYWIRGSKHCFSQPSLSGVPQDLLSQLLIWCSLSDFLSLKSHTILGSKKWWRKEVPTAIKIMPTIVYIPLTLGRILTATFALLGTGPSFRNIEWFKVCHHCRHRCWRVW